MLKSFLLSISQSLLINLAKYRDSKVKHQDRKFVYLEMPITFETKREWNAKGYKVADLATMPEGYDNPSAETEKPKSQPKGSK